MWISLLFFGVVASISTNEFQKVQEEGLNIQVILNRSIKNGVIFAELPLDYGGQKIVDDNKDINLLDENEKYHKAFTTYFKESFTKKGQTFNIYDDAMRNATIALFRILLNLQYNDRTKFEKLSVWAENNINSDMLDYATRLVALFSVDNIEDKFLPPFIAKPNYFVNGETILKAFYVKKNIEKISDDVMKVYQIFRMENNFIGINTNYSQWNGPFNACDREIKYFTEDVGLNSYYYGLHLLHPFWMSNEELSELNPRHAEHYHFAHQQLYARYLLEKEHLGSKLQSFHTMCELEFNPYLYYENGLPFPTRSSLIGQYIKGDLAYLKTIDTAIKECIHRGMVVMENGTYIKITDENYIDLLAKLIRANFDGIKATKVIRSLFGYGFNGYPNNKYNPSPSVLNHPQTTLREPVYWFLIKTCLDYFSEYISHTDPYDIAMYESDEYVISEVNISKISTNFQYFFINLYKSLEGDNSSYEESSPPFIFARQRRLSHEQFTVNFTITAKTQKEITIRLFLGPQCNIDNCNEMYFKFFKLDCYQYKLNEGINTVIWTSETPSLYSDREGNSSIDYSILENFDIFKFPKNLLIPKGNENGLNLTLFIMILDDEEERAIGSSLYNKIIREIDNKPLGFPLHRRVAYFNESAPNYRFINVSIFHNNYRNFQDQTGYYSSNLY